MAKAKTRADELLFSQGLAPSRSNAQALIMAGRVAAQDGRPVSKAGELLPFGTVLVVKEGARFVSRGGEKLQGALEDLKIDPSGMNCLDLGSSTGGFTDCLLKNGAKRVTAVDVGKGIMHQSLRDDPRVLLLEEKNARHLDGMDTEKDLSGPFDLAVMDLSFISLSLILPAAAPLLKEKGLMLAMVKPQFEAGKGKAGKRGVVKDPAQIREAINKISSLAPALKPPFQKKGEAYSRLLGAKGNQEVFVLMERCG
jgi:23S rRNA (cytidine1920-2'-O)/16S rRNA (cytidine1409-2'-O)-methyltransferase